MKIRIVKCDFCNIKCDEENHFEICILHWNNGIDKATYEKDICFSCAGVARKLLEGNETSQKKV